MTGPQRDASLSARQPSSALRALLGLFVLSIALGIGFFAGVTTMWAVQRASTQVGTDASLSPTPLQGQIDARQQGFTRLQKIIDILEEEYYDADELDTTQMLRGAARGLVASLTDPYTMYVEPVQAAIMQDDMAGAFEGIGATVSVVEDGIVIVSVQEGGPAELAGLEDGDVILQADDTPLAGLDLLDAVTLVRGPKGSVVRLSIRREGVNEPFVVPVTRDRVETSIVSTRMLDGDVAYLYLAEFNAISQERLKAALKELLAQNPQGLILDLRGNPGGLLDQAVAVSGEFLPRRALVVTQRWSDGRELEYRVSQKGVATTIPMVVLINGGSASASEIVAGALHDHERATLIGEPTFGKGAVQNVHRLDDGSSLRVTISKYYMPNGESPNLNPIQPDILVALTADDVSAGADPQLDRALQYLQTGR